MDGEHPLGSKSYDLQKHQTAVEQQSLLKRSLSLDETGTTDYSKSVSDWPATVREDEKRTWKAYPGEAFRSKEGRETEGLAVKINKSGTRGR